MKTTNMIYKMFKAMSLIAMSVILANCGKSDNGGGSTTTSGYYVSGNQCYLNNVVQTSLSSCQSATSTYYGYVNGQCYQIGGGVYTPTSNYSLCANAYQNTQYQWVNGLCVNVTTGAQQSNTALCNSSSTGIGYGNLCNGLYTDGSVIAQCTEGVSGYSYSTISTMYGTRQVIVMDCSGYTLYQYNQSTGGFGSVVSCQ